MTDKNLITADADRVIAFVKGVDRAIARHHRALAEAMTLDEVKAIHERARAFEAVTNALAGAREVAINASELRLAAERRFGDFLRELPKNNGRLRRGNKLSPRDDDTPTLAELGIVKHESSRWQRAAAVPEDVVADYVAAARENGGSVSSVGLIDFAAKRDARSGRRAAFQSDEKRHEYDFYATPPYATEALLAREEFSPVVWEPAAGDGAITAVLKDHGYEVRETDLQTGTDFLTTNERLADTIITNPPYRHALKFVEHARQLGVKKTAMLLPLDFVHGTTRYQLFTDRAFPLRALYVFARRVQFTDGGSAPMPVAWFVWDTACKAKPFIAWIPPAAKDGNGGQP